MSDFVTMWEEAELCRLQSELELEALKANCLPKKRSWKKALAVVATLVCSAAPALAIAASNGYFEPPPEPPAPVAPFSHDVMVETPEAAPIVVPVVVTAKAPERAKKAKTRLARGPRSCTTRALEMYSKAGSVRVCATPASPTPTRLSTREFAQLYR